MAVLFEKRLAVENILHGRRTGLCPTLTQPSSQRDGMLMRISLVGGAVGAVECGLIADLAERHGNGMIELTNRGNLQLRGIGDENVTEVVDELVRLGFGTDAARTVTISPFAGSVERQARNEIVAALDLAGYAGLSNKFVVHIDDSAGRTASQRGDIVVRIRRTGTATVRLDHLGEAELPADDLAGLVSAVAACCADHGRQSRLRDALAASTPRHFVAELASALGHSLRFNPPPEADLASCDVASSDVASSDFASSDVASSDFVASDVASSDAAPADPSLSAVEAITDPAPAQLDPIGVLAMRRTDAAPFFAIASVPLGRLDPMTLRRLGALCTDHGIAEMRLTPWKAIAFACTTEAQAKDVLAGAAQLGLAIDRSHPSLGVVACIGATGCWQTELDTLSIARAIIAERSTHGPQSTVAATLTAVSTATSGTVHVSGCDKSCAFSGTAAVTFVGRNDAPGFERIDAGDR